MSHFVITQGYGSDSGSLVIVQGYGSSTETVLPPRRQLTYTLDLVSYFFGIEDIRVSYSGAGDLAAQFTGEINLQ